MSLERDNSGQATACMTLLIAPEESDAVIARIKGMGRVQNFNVQTERVAKPQPPAVACHRGGEPS